jgi:hypothetical protein
MTARCHQDPRRASTNGVGALVHCDSNGLRVETEGAGALAFQYGAVAKW